MGKILFEISNFICIILALHLLKKIKAENIILILHYLKKCIFTIAFIS